MSRFPRAVRRWGALSVVVLLGAVLSACNPPPNTPHTTRVQRYSVFSGIGAWVDLYDWSPSFDGTVSFHLSDVDNLATRGVKVLYIQTSKSSRPDAIFDQDLFKQIVARAHSHGMRVISWYLPGLADMRTDYLRLVLPVWLGVDGIAWDIEDTKSVPDIALRNKRLVDLSGVMRKLYKDTPMAAIVLPPVVTDIINRNYWPQFPWHDLDTHFDAWMPMSYFTNRTTASGWRDAEKYTKANIDMVRANLGDAHAPISVIGGIADQTTTADVAGFVQAAKETSSIGVSLYDAVTSAPARYDELAAFNK